MRSYYCDKCKFSGTRNQVRKHLREEHLINKRGLGTMSDYFYSKDENGNKRYYQKRDTKRKER